MAIKEYDHLDSHYEFVVEFKDGSRDWVDPVYFVNDDNGEGQIVVKSAYGFGYEYSFEIDLIDKWTVRLYDRETTLDRI